MSFLGGVRLGDLPLPATRFIPGRTSRPRSGLFMDVADRAPKQTDPDRWRENEAWLYGFSLYDAGFFWETHEVWEPVWMGTAPNSAERQLVQGLIQLTNGCLKLAMERPKAAIRLVRETEIRLKEARNRGTVCLMGVDLDSVQSATVAFLASSVEWAERSAEQVLDERPRIADDLEEI